MEGLITLLILFSFVMRIAKKANVSSTNKKKPGDIFEKIASFAEKLETEGNWDMMPKIGRSNHEPTRAFDFDTEKAAADTQELFGSEMIEPADEWISETMIEPPQRYFGSLGMATMEGEDTCDPLLQHTREPREQEWMASRTPETLNTLPMPFTKSALLQSVVMSEILTHPSQRKWGRK